MAPVEGNDANEEGRPLGESPKEPSLQAGEGKEPEVATVGARMDEVTPPLSTSPHRMGGVTPPLSTSPHRMGGVIPSPSVVLPGQGEEKDDMGGADISEGMPETTLRPRGNSTSKVAEVRTLR